MAKFRHLLLEEDRFVHTGGQRQLDVAPGWTAIWHQAAIGEEQSQQAAHISGLQKFFPTNLHYSQTRRADCLLSRTLTIWSVSSHVD